MLPGSGPDTGSDGAVFAGTIDEIVAALDQDPVLVEEVMGNGQTEALQAALLEKAEASQLPVYVVLTKAPAGLTTQNTAEELLTLLHARSGKDGVWLVSTADVGHVAMQVYGDLDPAVDDEFALLRNASTNARDEAFKAIRSECGDCQIQPALEIGVTLDVLAHGIPQEWGTQPLTDAQVDSYTSSLWTAPDTQTAHYERAEMPTAGLYAVVATVTALTVAVVAYRLVQAIGGKRHPRLRGSAKPAPPTLAERNTAVVDARREAAAAYRALEKALGRTGNRVTWERRDIATACLERAESRIGADDLLEVVGGLVLARTGSYALAHATGQYRCCYVDPRHGAAAKEAPLGGGVQVPVCAACAAALAGKRPLAPLLSAGRFGSLAPYYERSSVWSHTGFGSLGGDWWQEVPR